MLVLTSKKALLRNVDTLTAETSSTDDAKAIFRRFHQGSMYLTGDKRTIIGVVHWYPACQEKPAESYWPTRALDRCRVLKMGSPYGEKVLRAKRLNR